MLAGKCDRCGKFYDLNGKITTAIERFSEIITNQERVTNKSLESVHYELCPDCVAEFNSWVNMEEEAEET